MISGKDLIAMGYKPGKWFKDAIEHINENHLTDEKLENYLQQISPKEVLPLDKAIPYFSNIRAENEVELENIKSVDTTMMELMKTPTMIKGAIMPDACPTGEKGQIPVGGVAVAQNAIHPAMHSADICCSVMMTGFGKIAPKSVLDAAHAITHFGPGGRDEFSNLPSELVEQICSNPFLNNERSKTLAATHLGTQGDGNHFLFVGVSAKSGETIMVTHHGSRGFGAQLYAQGMKMAEFFRKEISPKTRACNAWIPFDTGEGNNYWEALQIVRVWTKLNHRVIHDAVLHSLHADITERFWNEHNFV
ncbi:MAG TPA: RtcB family protein, partial [bacterium]|nr:RtcB family protein [bacterium]